MIILDEGRKDPTDPTVGPTNREYPQSDPAARGSPSRPPSPNPTLPDYETSEAQQPSNLRKPSRIRKFWNSRVGRLLSYALVLYSTFVLVVGVPIFVLKSKSHHHKSKFKWDSDDGISDYGPMHPLPPPSMGQQKDLSPHDHDETTFSCSTWDELTRTTAGIAEMNVAFPLVEKIALRLNSSAHELDGYVSGSLRVDMNPEKSVSNAVLMANARYSNSQLVEGSSVCLTHLGNSTQLMIHIPEKTANSTDTMVLDLQLLLPQTATPINFEMFVTSLPAFKQVLGNLPHVFFERIKLEGSHSPIAVGSISAASVMVQTTNADISGNFSASKKIYLDTVNGAVSVNVSLLNNKKLKKHTRLIVETGNGPILANVNLAVEERVYFTTPKHRNFVMRFKTFNAPMNVSIAHTKGSKPARLAVHAENSQGPIDVSLDPLYTGTFDLRTKSASAKVQETIVSDNAISLPPPPPIPHMDSHHGGHGYDDDMHELHFVYTAKERARGWIGDSRRPEQLDRHTISRVELSNSLSPVRLHWAQLGPLSPTSIRR